MSVRADEDMVVAWCGEAISRGAYGSAVSVIPLSFSTDPGRSWHSAVYQFDRRIGTWDRAVRNFTAFEREKINRISQTLQEKSPGVFAEECLIEYLAIRGLDNQIDEVVSFAKSFDASSVDLEMCPGILESWTGTDRYRPAAPNPFEPVAEQALQTVAKGLHREGDRAFVFSNSIASNADIETADLAFNLRLGKALEEWAGKTGKDEWARVGRSLALSVILSADNDGSVPETMTIGPAGEFIPSGARIGSARLYKLLGSGEYSPRAVATGVDGIWAWTAASSVSVTRDDRQMVISVGFPAGQTHYIMLNNISRFPLLQINETNWRSAADFESYYDSSGWVYFERDQVLVLKLRHRSPVERIRILFYVP